MQTRWFKIRTGCRACGFHATAQGDARDVVRALDSARDGVAQCATCGAPIHEVEAWEDRWDGWYVSGFRGTRPGATWEEDGDSDYVRTYAREYVWTWRMVGAMGGEPFAFQFEEYGAGQVETSYATEEDARADHDTWCMDVEDDDVELLQVHRSELEVRA